MCWRCQRRSREPSSYPVIRCTTFTRKLQEGRRGGWSFYKSIFVLFMYNNGINRDSNYETFNLSPFSASVILCLEPPLAGANWKISNYVPALWYTVMNLYRRHYTVVVLGNGALTWQNPSWYMYEALLAPIKSTLASSATQIGRYLLALSSKRAKQYLTRN